MGGVWSTDSSLGGIVLSRCMVSVGFYLAGRAYVRQWTARGGALAPSVSIILEGPSGAKACGGAEQATGGLTGGRSAQASDTGGSVVSLFPFLGDGCGTQAHIRLNGNTFLPPSKGALPAP